mgnify:CR=1 FL=1
MTTNETKVGHAPATWTAHKTDDGKAVNRVYAGSRFVCETRQGEEGYADAVAIAALPDLKAALLQFVDCHANGWGIEDRQRAMVKARAAIAKAK